MALKPRITEHARTAGHVSHGAQQRVDKRVEKILARRAQERLTTPTAGTRPVKRDDPESVSHR
jgi:hypothetical protein